MEAIETGDSLTAIHKAVGGDQPFYDLIEAFYAGLASDPILRPMYPADLSGAKLHLGLFLIQRFGGGGKYTETRGHPRLRMRHMPFRIGREEKQAWLRHMSAAIETVPVFDPYRAQMLRYFENTAEFLVNSTDRGAPAHGGPAPVGSVTRIERNE